LEFRRDGDIYQTSGAIFLGEVGKNSFEGKSRGRSLMEEGILVVLF